MRLLALATLTATAQALQKEEPRPITDATVDPNLIPDEPKEGGGDADKFHGWESEDVNPLEHGIPDGDNHGIDIPKGDLKDVMIPVPKPPATLKPGTIVALKGGKHGKYCADENHNGRIICNRNAIGGWERFTVVAGPNGKIGLKGGRQGKFCADEGNRIICNRNWVRSWEQFTVVPAGPERMALKGGRHGKFCADEGNTVKCNRNKVQGWERFFVQVIGQAPKNVQACPRPNGWCSHAGSQYWAHFDCNGDGIPDPYCQDPKGNVGTIPSGNGYSCPSIWPKANRNACKAPNGAVPPAPVVVPHNRWIALRGGRANKWCADEGNRLICNRGWIKGWEKFYTVHAGGGKIALRGGKHNKWCADESNTVRCNRPWIKGWEKFFVQSLGGGRVGIRGGRANGWCADEGHRVVCNRGTTSEGRWVTFHVHLL